ncbi:hypothetical protein JKP88DRAFT_251893 [Tribonema minus]|uniref:RING-type domain-containing protein n=1 Tax=Tribonema minus TaxID=303371 RepID=A0A835ZEJ9_9STRA|nr:hypothetical protein JKP88DRAFT_251893 [Tribonema minus]
MQDTKLKLLEPAEQDSFPATQPLLSGAETGGDAEEQHIEQLVRRLETEARAVDQCFRAKAHALIKRRSPLDVMLRAASSVLTSRLSPATPGFAEHPSTIVYNQSDTPPPMNSPRAQRRRADAARALAYARAQAAQLRALAAALDAAHGTKAARTWLSAAALAFAGGHALDELVALTLEPAPPRRQRQQRQRSGGGGGGGGATAEAAALGAVLDETLTSCPICLEIMYRPCATPCSHRLCAGCVAEVLARAKTLQTSADCPCCRATGAVGRAVRLWRWGRLLNTVYPLEYTAQRLLVQTLGHLCRLTPHADLCLLANLLQYAAQRKAYRARAAAAAAPGGGSGLYAWTRRAREGWASLPSQQ